MPRVAYLLMYDGSLFRGFIGSEGSVHDHLVQAFRKIVHVNAHELKFTCASRTDPGVSAIKNVIAVTLPRVVRPEELNSELPEGLRVWGYAVVPDDFSARSAYCREYVYLKKYEGEDLERMNACAKLFVGKHNFVNFQIIDKEQPTEAIIYDLSITNLGDVLLFRFSGQGFRNKMIRKIVWTLVQVGKGKMSINEVRDLIEVKIRRTVPSAPAEGLILLDVKYRQNIDFHYSTRALLEGLAFLKKRLDVLRGLVLSLEYAFSIIVNLITEKLSKP